MVTSAVGGPTYRVGVFLDAVLKPISKMYCNNELVKDSTDFLRHISREPVSQDLGHKYLIAMDVCALYPNIKIDVALEAVRYALDEVSDYSDKEKDALISLLDYCLKNSVVHYRGDWYQSKEGAPTGNPEIPSVANIFVKYVLDQKILVDSLVSDSNFIEDRKRFLDDIWGVWNGDEVQFLEFHGKVNLVGRK